MDPDDISGVFAALDVDGDGMISATEFDRGFEVYQNAVSGQEPVEPSPAQDTDTKSALDGVCPVLAEKKARLEVELQALQSIGTTRRVSTQT